MGRIYNIVLCLIVLLFSGCVTAEKDRHSANSSQPGLTIKHINDLPDALLPEVKKENSPRAVYIIVHPSYYLFFHDKDFSIIPSESKNVVQTFLETTFAHSDAMIHLMKVYERAEIELIASSMDKKSLVILIIPGGYRTSEQYLYRNSSDEYARYLNEVADGADSVFYIESQRLNSGKISKDDLSVLLDILKKIDAEQIYIGGGYIGRCQEEFYTFFSQSWNASNLTVIPEISAFSPNDISNATARMLMTNDKRINSLAMKYFLKNGGIDTLGRQLNVQSILEVDSSD